MLGCTHGMPGGGFLYTNLDTVSVGVVVSLPDLAGAGVRPEELIADLKEPPVHRPATCGGPTLQEYAAHLIPEGGYDAMPALATDGMLVAGDAAAMTLAAGIWLEGVNFAIGSGLAAGRAADRALARPDRGFLLRGRTPHVHRHIVGIGTAFSCFDKFFEAEQEDCPTQ